MNRKVALTVTLGLALGRSAAAQPADPQRSILSRVRNRAVNAALQRTLPMAARKLANPKCAKVLLDFTDASGRRLADTLAAMNETAPLYLSLIVFADGHGRSSCTHPRNLAVTGPGSRVVYLCPQFAVVSGYSDGDRANVLIHEALHSLGLGENPPSAHEITAVIEQFCGR